MHILLDARTATPHFPGIGRYVGELALALAETTRETRDKLTVVIPPDCTFELETNEQVRTVVTNRTVFDPRQQAALSDIANQLQPDIYHSPYYLMPTLNGIPTVLTMHDCIPLMQPGESSLQARTLFRTCAARALKASTTVIAVSETTRQDSLRFFPEAKGKFTTIPHGVHARFTPQSEAAISAVTIKYGLTRPYLIYFGSNRPHKNIATLLVGYSRARPLLKGHGLVIAGYGSEATRLERSILRREHLAANVSWIGSVIEDDLPALLSSASMLVFPSLYEGFGLPVLEAMATGTPVVCSNTPSLRELGADAVTYFDPKDPKTITQALVNTVTANSGSRETAIQAGLERAAHYRWDKVAAATLEVYRVTLANQTTRVG